MKITNLRPAPVCLLGKPGKSSDYTTIELVAAGQKGDSVTIEEAAWPAFEKAAKAAEAGGLIRIG